MNNMIEDYFFQVRGGEVGINIESLTGLSSEEISDDISLPQFRPTS